MKARRKIAAVVLLLAVCGLVSCGRKPEKVLRADSQDLKDTTITAHLEEKIVPGKNLIYCSTFQLAWNVLRDDMIKEDIRLEGDPPLADFLNKKLFTKDDLSEECYLAMVGFKKDDIIGRINRALKSKFGTQAPTVTAQLWGPESIYAYAFLLKSLEFPTPFENLKKPLSFRSPSGPVDVSAFGMKEYAPRTARVAKTAEQVSVLAYDYNTDECVLRLASESPEDEIIMARIQPKETMLQTLQSVGGMIQEGRPESLDEDDFFQMPKLDFDIRHDYRELLGRDVLNPAFTDYYVYKARQDIRFCLNEKGALLKSQAEIQLEAEPQKNLVFDCPFLLYLKEKQAKYPYLAIWVDNPDILLKY